MAIETLYWGKSGSKPRRSCQESNPGNFEITAVTPRKSQTNCVCSSLNKWRCWNLKVNRNPGPPGRRRPTVDLSEYEFQLIEFGPAADSPHDTDPSHRRPDHQVHQASIIKSNKNRQHVWKVTNSDFWHVAKGWRNSCISMVLPYIFNLLRNKGKLVNIKIKEP